MISTSHVIDRFNVKVSGRGTRTLVFAHGFGCDQAMWRFVAPAFEAQFRVVLFDYAGHGGGDPDAHDRDRHNTLHGYADDVLEICDAVSSEPVTLVGHSVSATVALLAAARAPVRFDRLVLVGPSLSYVNDPPSYHGGFAREDLEGLLEMMHKNYTAWAGALAPVIVANADRPEFAEELERSFCAIDPDIARQFAAVTFLSDHRDIVSQIATPSLILQCADDVIAPDSAGEFLAQRLPNNTYYRMVATGHTPHLTHPAETIAVMQRYLSRAPGEPLRMGEQ